MRKKTFPKGTRVRVLANCLALTANTRGTVVRRKRMDRRNRHAECGEWDLLVRFDGDSGPMDLCEACWQDRLEIISTERGK